MATYRLTYLNQQDEEGRGLWSLHLNEHVLQASGLFTPLHALVMRTSEKGDQYQEVENSTVRCDQPIETIWESHHKIETDGLEGEERAYWDRWLKSKLEGVR